MADTCNKDTRPDWDTYFMSIAQVVATRANCSRRKVAAVIVSENRIISTGYNGTPRGITNCFDGGCPRCSGNVPSGSSLEECICVHAEQNAICQAAYYGIRLAGSTIYVTLTPCLTCAKMIINAGIREVVYAGNYAFDVQTQKLLADAGVVCRKYIAPETTETP
ncbi:MAG: dCMP deaminase family protein [Kiritimatiellae bacterium]|nr:dCMP deaminase family protein [Kiritimatiellia bacterium]